MTLSNSCIPFGKTMTFQFPIKFRLKLFCDNWRYPTDLKNPFGYLFIFMVEYVGILCAACASAGHTCFVTGSCWMLVTLVKDIQHSLYILNERAIAKSSRSKLLNHLSEILQLHSSAKQLSRVTKYFFRSSCVNENNHFQVGSWLFKIVRVHFQLIVSCYICWLKFICNRISSCFDVHLVKYTYSSCLLLIWTFR